ncbi:ABC Superfamily [Phytophthora palmivora]|uniref:ABC Superfamily n=1 Tax=Phytophthora palmivora TaxID=4796 RepID=A0A2P4X883_9STRA|nr:ABC Superfamily [Phytophthora palmivora]
MRKQASTHGASAPWVTSRSQTAKAKSKDKEGARMSPDDGPNPRFAYRDHSSGEGSPVFGIPMLTGSESAGDSPGSTKDPTPSQDGLSQDAPVEDTASSEANVVPTSSPTQNLTLDEARSPWLSFFRAFHRKVIPIPVRPSDEDEEKGAITEPQEISNDLDEQQERYQATQLQGVSEVAFSVPPTPVYPRGYYPPNAGSGSPMFLEHLKAPRGLNHGCTLRGAYERASVQDELLFVNDIEAARCVLLAPHRIPLKEFTSLRKKPEACGGLFPVWGYPWVQPENTTTQSQAEDLF